MRGVMAAPDGGRIAIVVTTDARQPTVAELERLAACGRRPRKDYVELARPLEAEVIDVHHMRERATPVARLAARVLGLPAGQVLEVLLRRRRYRRVLAWGDRLGIPLALLLKLTRSRRDLVMISVWLSRPRKEFFLRVLRVHTHMRAIIGRRSQLALAERRVGIPRAKLHEEPRSVDDRFWTPAGPPGGRLLCAVGWEERDYATMLEAVRELSVEVEVAVGSFELQSPEGAVKPLPALPGAEGMPVPPNVRLGQRDAQELRQLYSHARMVVVPLRVADHDAGVTAATEAMAMGRPVVLTRTPGSEGLIEHGVHGLYVPPGDIQALRAAITRLLENEEEAERMGRAGRSRALERHALDLCTERLATYFA